jgi:hypothetical protein
MVDEILTGDQLMAFAYVTPAKGVVLQPLSNTGNPAEPVTSSAAMWRKLERIRENPQVALAYHTRKHSLSDRPEYVLVQGRASLGPVEDTGWIDRNREAWEHFAGQTPKNAITERYLRAYHWRVPVQLDIERMVIWPDLACAGTPAVEGSPLPGEEPASQKAPGKGTGPRVPHRRAVRHARSVPHVLLGWVGSDGFPVIMPVEVGDAVDEGIVLRGHLPPGARRAGLLAHDFARHAYGQNLRKYTGWLDGSVYAPHTKAGYRFPESRVMFKLVSGAVTTWRLRGARRAGFIPK